MQGIDHLSKVHLEQHLENGHQSILALMTLLSANKYAEYRDGLESITDALRVIEIMQEDLCK